MSKLKETERHNGCIYTLLERAEKWVMYAQAYSHTPDNIIGYEVFKIRKSKGVEKFPKTSDWGNEAFTSIRRPQSIAEYFEHKAKISAASEAYRNTLI